MNFQLNIFAASSTPTHADEAEAARKYLHDGRRQLIARPSEEHTPRDLRERIISYRTEVCLALNEATTKGDRLAEEHLRREYEWCYAQIPDVFASLAANYPKPEPPQEWNPYYVIFAQEQGRTPEEQLREGSNVEYMIWNSAKWTEWERTSQRSRYDVDAQERFSAFLGATFISHNTGDTHG